MLAKNITELIGNTPMLELNNIAKELELKARIIAKLEYFNPAGSIKDRVAKSMIDDAELSGKLKPGGTIIEPTSGNTGVGIAMNAAARGYKAIMTMPETMSVERQMLLKALGAKVVLTPGANGMQGAVDKAEELQRNTPNSVILQQFSNPANPQIHESTTAPEIWKDTQGEIDIFVAGVGTGGTISGTGEELKRLKPNVKIVAVEPESSPLLTEGHAGPHMIQGIGANFIPANYNASTVDEIIDVPDNEAIKTSRMLGVHEGLLVGISSGAAVWAAIQLARRKENAGKCIVAILPDTGERYLSTKLYDVENYPI